MVAAVSYSLEFVLAISRLQVVTKFVVLLLYSSSSPAFVPRSGAVVLVMGVGLQHALK